MSQPAKRAVDLAVADLAVTFATGDAPALAVEVLRVPAGQRLALTGPSGSGKTTLAHAVTGIQPVSRGSIRWGDVDLTLLSEADRDRWRRHHLGLVFQEFHLIPGLSPLANVLVPTYFGALRPSEAQKLRAQELLDRFGVPAARRDIDRLSRGEQQRVALARALLGSPPILVVDEPTASLDGSQASDLACYLCEAAAAGGCTLIAISHDDELVAMCERRLRLERGRIVADERIGSTGVVATVSMVSAFPDGTPDCAPAPP